MGCIIAPTSASADPAPLSAADRDLLAKVKQAGLWEMPTGADLAQRGSTSAIRDVGRKISAEHKVLDQKTIDAAAAVGLTLPTESSPEQQGWVNEVRQANDVDMSRIAVNRLRAAHGKVLPLLAQVKVGTRNPVVRAFATDASVFVSRHITYLESTGLVDFNALPEPTVAPTTTSAPSAVAASDESENGNAPIYAFYALVGIVVILVAAGLWWFFFGRRASAAQHSSQGKWIK